MDFILEQFKNNNDGFAKKIIEIFIENSKQQDTLRKLLSEHCKLDYFGECYHGDEKVSSFLVERIYESEYEFSTLTFCDQPPTRIHNADRKKDDEEDDLGVSMMSPTNSSYSSLQFETPIKIPSGGILSVNGNSMVDLFSRLCSSSGKSENAQQCSPICRLNSDASENTFPDDLLYVSVQTTVSYSKKKFPGENPKMIKHRGVGTARKRTCLLVMGFQYYEKRMTKDNLCIWLLQYNVSSKLVPRNLLKSFNDVETN